MGVSGCVLCVVDWLLVEVGGLLGVVGCLRGVADSLLSLVVWSLGMFSPAASEWRSRWRAWCLRSVRALFSLSTSRLKES